METVVLRTEHLGRSIGDKRLVDDVNLEVRRQDLVAVVGPSGSGKTSFLRLLNRLDEPSSGTVYLNGQDYRTIAPRMLRHQVGMVMQSPFLFPGTVADNLCFGPRQRGEELTLETIEDLLQQVDLAGYAGRNVEGLSGGEAQRVSLARTLANSPDVLLLDEPTAALDDEAKQEVEALLGRILHAQSIPCLLVTHDMAQAQRLATHVMVMDHGRMIRFGLLNEVLHAEPIVR